MCGSYAEGKTKLHRSCMEKLFNWYYVINYWEPESTGCDRFFRLLSVFLSSIWPQNKLGCALAFIAYFSQEWMGWKADQTVTDAVKCNALLMRKAKNLISFRWVGGFICFVLGKNKYIQYMKKL